ncbi:MAG TPA: hypothetical protein VG939_15105 [Caulobacteraceae bacterium]|nr:hypothetical protein [Caulobacteraceae bacterium]
MFATPRAIPRWALPLLVAASFLLILVPFAAIEIPPLTDYPNHLARFWLIAGGVTQPPMPRFFAIDWSRVSTNMGLDLMVLALSKVASGFTLARAAMVLAALAPPLGALALNLRLWRRFDPWQALLPLAAWSTTFLMGFLNFQIGLGLALAFAALDPMFLRGPKALEPSPVRSNRPDRDKKARFFEFERLLIAQPVPTLAGGALALVRVPLGLVLAANHLFALLFYAVLLAGLAFGREGALPPRWPALFPRLRRAALAGAWCLIPLAMVVLWGRALPGSQVGGFAEFHYDSVAGVLTALVSPLVTYNVPLELVIAILLGAFVTLLARRGLIEAHTGLLVAAIGLEVLSLLTPNYAAGTGWVARRMPIMALLAAASAVRLTPAGAARAGFAFSAAALAMVAGRTGWVAWNWTAMQPNIAAVEQVLAEVPAGAAVLPAQHKPSGWSRFIAPPGRYIFSVDDPTFRHYAALATPLRRAFVPNLFSSLGKQPLQILGDWDPLVEHDGADLASVSSLNQPPTKKSPRYLAGWRSRFDYLLVLNADLPDAHGPFRPPPGVTLVADRGFAQLWKIQR